MDWIEESEIRKYQVALRADSTIVHIRDHGLEELPVELIREIHCLINICIRLISEGDLCSFRVVGRVGILLLVGNIA